MSTIKFLTYAQNVEQNRQALIQHCRDEGKTVSDDASLSSVVAINNTITGQGSSSGDTWVFKRRVFNYDGTLLEETPVEVGDAITPPSTTPTIDDPLLEFDSWVCDTDETTVTHSYSYGAFVRVKEQIDLDGELVRPTIIKMLLSSAIGLSPSIKWRCTRGASANYPVYIDWGDGTVDTVTSATSGVATHTYSSEGEKIIKYYAKGLTSSYYLGLASTTSSYSFGSMDYNKCVTALYCGSYFQCTNSNFYYCQSLEIVTGLYAWGGSIGDYAFGNCSALKSVYIKPSTATAVTTLGLSQQVFTSCYSLEVVILDTTKPASLEQGVFNNCYNLKYFNIPNNAIQIKNLGRAIMEELYYPDSLTTINLSSFIFDDVAKFIRFPLLTRYVSNMVTSPYIKKVTVQEGVSSIAGMFISTGNHVEELILPQSLHSIETNAFTPMTYLKKVIINAENLTISGILFGSPYSLEELYWNGSVASVSSGIFNGCFALKTLTLPANWNFAVVLSYCTNLTDASLINVAQNLKDLTGETAKTITFAKNSKLRMDLIKVDANGVVDENGTQTLTEYITGKNWTITAS